MQNTSRSRVRRLGGIVTAAILVSFGIVAIVMGLDGRSAVHSALKQQGVVGLPHMTPTAIAASVKEAGLQNVKLPTCSVAATAVDDGTAARCFAEYMRVDALMATDGRTYAQMPRFATADGRGTNDPASAQKSPDGRPVENPARSVWVTATALSNALNMSYMGERVALFGIAVGAAFLLVGLAFALLAMGGAGIPSLLRRGRGRVVARDAAGPADRRAGDAGAPAV